MQKNKKNQLHLLRSFLFLIFILLFIGLFFKSINAEETLEDLEKKRIAYEYGSSLQELEKFLKDPLVQEQIMKDPDTKAAFIKGVDEFTSKNPNIKLSDTFSKYWLVKDEKGKYKISDKTRNELWKEILAKKPEEANSLVKKVLEEKIKELKKKYPNKKKIPFNSVSITNPEKLVWDNGMLVKIDTNDKNKKAWIDIEKPSLWLESFEYNEKGVFKFKYDTGNGKKIVEISGGTIGPLLEIVDPNGKIIGATFDSGIESISYNSQTSEFEFKYKLGGKEDLQTLTISRADFKPEPLKKLEELTRKLVDPSSINPEQKQMIQDVLKNIGTLGIDFKGDSESRFHLPLKNSLSLGFGGSYEGNPEKYTIDYDNQGLPNIGLLNGAKIASLDANENVDLVFGQYASKGMRGRSKVDSTKYVDLNGLEDEKAELIFDKNGRFIQGKNVIGGIYQNGKDFGDFETSRDGMINVDIIRSGVIDSGAIESLAQNKDEESKKKLADMLNSILEDEEVFKKAIGGANLDVVKIVSKKIKEQLADPYLATESRIKTEKMLGILNDNLDVSINNFLGNIIQTQEGSSVSKDQMIDFIKASASEDARAAISKALQSDNLKNLITGQDSAKFNTAFRQILSSSVDGKLAGIFVSDLQQITDGVRALIPKDANEKNIDISKIIQDQINGIDFYNKIYGSGKDNSNNLQKLVSEGILQELQLRQLEYTMNQDQIEQLSKAIVATADYYGNILNTERQKYANGENLKSAYADSFKYLDEYNKNSKGRLTINVPAKTVSYAGEEYASFNANSLIREITVKSDSNEEGKYFKVYNNKEPIFYMQGENTYELRGSGLGERVVINNIKNLNDESTLYRYDQIGARGFKFYDQTEFVTQFNAEYAISVPLIGGFMILSKQATVPYQAYLELHTEKEGEYDSASSPDSHLDMYTVVNSELAKQRFQPIKNVVRKIALKSVYEKSPDLPTGMIADELESGFNNQLVDFQKRFNSESEVVSYLDKQSKLLEDLESYGAKVPDSVKDMIYVAKNPQEFQRVITFFRNAGGAGHVSFTPNSISIDGRTIEGGSDINPAVLRTIMRQVYQKAMVNKYHSR